MVRPLTYIVFILFISTFQVYGEGLKLSPARKGAISTRPGHICSVVYKIENETGENLQVSTKLILPDKWQPVTGTLPVDLKAGEQKTGLISFRVPDFTPAGQYNITYEATSGETWSGSFDFTVEVQEVIELSMELAGSSGHVAAGSQASAQFIITNDGNSAQTVILEPFNGIIQGAATFQLDVGASRIVNVSSEVQKDITSVSNNSIRLTARVAGHDDIFTNKFYTYKIIPVREEENDLYFRFPVDASIRYLMRNNKGAVVSGFQGQIVGNGFLDLEKTKHLTFLARGPNQFNLSALGMYDQYFAAYSQKEFMVFLGDKSYRLSPLTEMSRYGRGGQAEGRAGRFRFGGFYQQPRFYPYIKDELAGYVNFRFFKENYIGISYLRKRYTESTDDSHLLSVGLKLQPFQNSLLEMEFSGGLTGGKKGYGLYTNFIGNWQKVNVSATLVYASKYYPGYYTNSLFYTVNGSWRITRRLSFNANIRQDYQNAARDTLFGAAPYNQGYNAGLGYRFSKDIDLRIYYDHHERMDRAAVAKFHYRENVFRLYFMQKIKNFGYYLNGEAGKNENLLLPPGNRISNTYKTTADLYYDINGWLQLGGFVSFMSNNRYSAERINSWIYGASLSAVIARDLRVNVWYQSNYELEDYYRNRSLFNANLDWMITKNHEINITANYALLQKQVYATDYSAAFTYTWHFGVPLKRVGQAGTVNGKINNMTSRNEGGVILHLNGHSVITDPEGNFTLKNLKPGTYYLLIDRSTLGIHQLPDVPEPIAVEVKGGEETYVTFGLTTAAKVEGKIEVNRKGKGIALLDDDENPGRLILEMKNENESVKVISEDDGTFRFPDIRPGKWTLKVYPNGLSGKYKIEKDQFDLTLQPGQQTDIPVWLTKKERKIIFVSENIELSENTHKTTDD